MLTSIGLEHTGIRNNFAKNWITPAIRVLYYIKRQHTLDNYAWTSKAAPEIGPDPENEEEGDQVGHPHSGWEGDGIK